MRIKKDPHYYDKLNYFEKKFQKVININIQPDFE